MTLKKILISSVLFLLSFIGHSQEEKEATVFKKRVLETIEVDLLSSFYAQDGDHAAVNGGIGLQEMTDFTATMVVAIPLSDDDVITIDTGISAYTSASSSNVDPFDGKNIADPFVASSGASKSDVWVNFTTTYSHSSDDRNQLWSAIVSVSSEYDYSSIGGGGSFTKLFNEKNTTVSLSGHVYIDVWKEFYPIELRAFAPGGVRLDGALFYYNTMTGNSNYNPIYQQFEGKGRNSYSLGLNMSQILSKKLQGSLVFDVILQKGLLSTPFHRIYFSDVADSFIENFHLADTNEKLPDTRLKIALGGRLNYYFNEFLILRTFYRYYTDDWGIKSHTISVEAPIKITDKFTLYPSYRYYNQTGADYFAPYEQHLSTQEFYTSDYDLSQYHANQFGFGVRYTDIFTKAHVWKFGLKSIELKHHQYDRSTGLKSNIISGGLKFVME
ncbi:MAG: hypothetical protein COB60_09855 [Flavobacteriaceae bacterium]|nr:MAG: hypothetical protein COB60_09855 [Flavobacteriaceae bacterium]